MTTLSKKLKWAICLHWTAGNVNNWKSALPYYHYVVDKEGFVHEGHCTPEDNINTRDGKYAAHIAQANTKTIGIAVTGAHKNFKHGEYTSLAFEAMCKKTAVLCKKYSIPVEKEYVFTHYEYGLANPQTGNRGKIDINNIPHMPDISPNEVGNVIRNKVNWYLNKLNETYSGEPVPNPDIEAKVTLGLRFDEALNALIAGKKIKRTSKDTIYFINQEQEKYIEDLKQKYSLEKFKNVKEMKQFFKTVTKGILSFENTLNIEELLANDWEII